MAKSLDTQLELADVYAEALFELAEEAGRVDQVRSELEDLARLGSLGEPLADFLAADAIDPDRRADSLEKIFRGRLSDPLLNTLQVMNQHGRAALVPSLARAFALRQEHAAGQVEVTAVTAVQLTAAQRGAVERVARELSGRIPLVNYVVDPKILGGLVLTIGDWRFDNSLRRRLHELRARLRERADRGLAVGRED